MSHQQDFERLVDQAMSNTALAAMRPVVEKELLHYEIFQALDAEGLLKAGADGIDHVTVNRWWVSIMTEAWSGFGSFDAANHNPCVYR